MNYAYNFCTCLENYILRSKRHTFTFTGKCIVCGKEVSVEVDKESIIEYNEGKLIQDAMPMVSAANREFLISGCCDNCFNNMWKEEE